jgi:Domain of unknown function (DUF4432)
MVMLWGRHWSRNELLARVGRLEQLAGVHLVSGGDGAERGVRMLRSASGAGFDLEVLWASGEVRQVAVFGEQLELRRRIEVDLGGTAVRLVDRVTNIGPTACPHMLLYHCNIGFPVLDDGAELLYPSGPGVCVSDHGVETYAQLTGPQRPYVEQCYEHDMVTDPDGWVRAAVVNRAAGLGVYQRYRKDALPHHITWRQLGHGTYVVAMEPSTNHDAGRFDARERGELQHLEPGEHRDYDLELGVLAGAEQIGAFEGALPV